MSSIEAQLGLEKQMLDRGAEQYIRTQRKAEDAGRGSELDYSQRLMHDFMMPLIEDLKVSIANKGPGKYGRAKALLSRIEAEKAMFIAVKGLFNSFTLEEAAASTASKIGKLIEDEIRFSRFQELYGDYYDSIIKDFKRKGTKDYRYMHRVLTHSANTQEDGWTPWSPAEKVDVGMRLLDVIMRGTDLVNKKTIINKKRQQVILVPTQEALKWISDHEEMRQFMFPDRSPCIIEPDPWTGLNQGGYYSPELRQATPMIKASGPMHRKLLRDANLTNVMDALNTAQNVPWEVNTDVLTIAKAVWAQNLRIGMPGSKKLEPTKCPIDGIKSEDMTDAQRAEFIDWKREAAEVYTQEKERVSKSFQVSRIFRMANDYSQHAAFWYVWYADFRGRLYTSTAGFSPQGPDIAKGLLRFHRGLPLGDRGYYWLCVHGANRYGYDKVTYAERYDWVAQRHDEFMRAADDPLSHRDIWASADKPWQFLAFLFEYRKVHELAALGIAKEKFVSHLPIGLDGTCNGLQNFSAMLRDVRGGTATNLVPGERPADIYREVAAVCTDKVRALAANGDTMALVWLAYLTKYSKGQITRDLAKKPVMTMPYGSTRQTCTSYIFNEILKMQRKHGVKKMFEKGNFSAACWLTPLLWDSIGEVVVAARLAMDWLQKCASAANKKQMPIVWKTVDGFVVLQAVRKVETIQINTQLNGLFRVRVGDYTNELDKIKQRNGVAPNFIHSMDATHLRTTIRLAARQGIQDMAIIHDDYGTHAGNTDKLQNIIRTAFVGIYDKSNPLLNFQKAQEASGIKVPEIPPMGKLVVRDVLQSEYFFG